MAEMATQQLANLFKRLTKHFNRKFTQIVFILSHHKSAGSLGALAGFAIAIVFTWKFFRSPSKQLKRQRRQTGGAPTSNPAFVANDVSTSETSQLMSSTDELDLVDESQPRAKLELGQIISKKLNGSRKMTCQLLGVVLEERTLEELQDHATVRTSAVEVLQEISNFCDVYLMERIIDDESEERVLLALEKADLFKTGNLMRNKVLFSGTETGRASFVRQLEPDWHVDTNPEIIYQLSRFITYQLDISPAGSRFTSGSNVFHSTSLESYFSDRGLEQQCVQKRGAEGDE